MIRPSSAETLLLSLGVSRPEEIDLEAIAYCVGARVRYSPLQSCEARIIGYGERAIITVDRRMGAARARFSLGHELGHWAHHRGRSSVCRSDEIGGGSIRQSHDRERIADAYAADLLMPAYLFKPSAAALKRATFVAIDQLAATYKTSRIATALRMVDLGPEPAMLVCHGLQGRRWFRRGGEVPDRWFPRDELDAYSNAFEVLHSGVDKPQPYLVGADAWFDRREAEQHEVYEQSVRIGADVLTLLTFKGPRMLA